MLLKHLECVLCLYHSKSLQSRSNWGFLRPLKCLVEENISKMYLDSSLYCGAWVYEFLLHPSILIDRVTYWHEVGRALIEILWQVCDSITMITKDYLPKILHLAWCELLNAKNCWFPWTHIMYFQELFWNTYLDKSNLCKLWTLMYVLWLSNDPWHRIIIRHVIVILVGLLV